MEYRISIAGSGPLKISDRVPPGLAEYQIPGSKSIWGTAGFGNFLIQTSAVNGFSTLYGIFNIEEDVSLNLYTFAPQLWGNIVLQGAFEQNIRELGNFSLQADQFHIFYTPVYNSVIHFTKKFQYILLTISYPVEFMLSILDFYPGFEVFRNGVALMKPVVLTREAVYTNTEIQDLIYTILHPPASVTAETYYVHIRKELLSLLLMQASESQKVYLRIPTEQFESIYAAKELIEQNLRSHFPIAQIARKSGINEQKLKKGFKELFGCGLYAYRQSQILHISKTRIEQTKRPIKQIASMAGYRSANNFSVAFKKKFGLTPSALRKRFNSLL